jgi:hypothetical protein
MTLSPNMFWTDSANFVGVRAFTLRRAEFIEAWLNEPAGARIGWNFMI